MGEQRRGGQPFVGPLVPRSASDTRGGAAHSGSLVDAAGSYPPVDAADVPSPAVRVHVLGPLAVTVNGVPAPVTGKIQHRLITALALAGPGVPLDIGEMTRAVYGTAGPSRPRRALSTLVWRLRRTWGDAAIESDRYRYWLSETCCTVDAAEFEELLAADDRAEAPATRVATLQAALALWRSGEPDLPTPDRDRLTDLRWGATGALAALLAAERRAEEAIELLRPLVAQHPTWEHSAALLVETLRDSGDLSGSQQVIDTVYDALRAEGVEPGPVLRSAAAHPGTDPSAPAAVRTPPPVDTSCVGRDPERELLASIVRSALDTHRPAAILIHGEAGIGKTTLVQSALTAVRVGPRPEVEQSRPPTVVTSTCDRRSVLPFGPLAAVSAAVPDGELAPLLSTDPGTAAMNDASDVHAALLNDVRNLASPSGLVLVVEDAHVAPPETLRALIEVLRRCGSIPLAVIATTRDPGAVSSSGPAPDLPAVAQHAGARQPGMTESNAAHSEAFADYAALADATIALKGLTRADIAVLTASPAASARVGQLHDMTGGNPLYLRQLQQLEATRSGLPRVSELAGSRATGLDVAAPLPADMTAAIDAHLAQVPAATVAALATAAAIGDQFDMRTLTALRGPRRRSLTEWQESVTSAIRFGLIRPDGEGYRFVHALIAAHLYSTLSAHDTVHTHAAISDALQRLSLIHPCPPDIMAHHCTRGWPVLATRTVVEAAVVAAGAVGAQLDFARAADYYRTALDYLAMDPEAMSAQETADLSGAAAGASAASGDLAGAAQLYVGQGRLAAAENLHRSRVFAALGAVRLAFLRRSHPSAADPLVDALTDSFTDRDLHHYADLAGDALGAVWVYRPRRARELLAECAAQRTDVIPGFRLALWEHQTVADQLRTARELVSVTATTQPTESHITEPRQAAARLIDSSTAASRAVQLTAAERVAAWLRLWVSEVAAGLRRFDDPPPRDFSLRDASEQTGFDLAQWNITVEMTVGRPDRARAMIAAELAGPKHRDPAERARRAASFYGQRLYLALSSGDSDELATSPITTNPTWASRHPIMRYIRAYLAALRGDGARVRDMITEIVDEILEGDIPDSDIGPRLILTTGACLRVGDQRGLRACIPQLERHRTELGIFRFGQNWGSIAQSLGDAQVALGEREAAISAYRQAIAVLEATGSVAHVPAARRSLAAVSGAHTGP